MDVHLTNISQLIPDLTTKLNRGDETMADRGFAVHDLFANMGVSNHSRFQWRRKISTTQSGWKRVRKKLQKQEFTWKEQFNELKHSYTCIGQ